jgi:osmoprotectant transport system substrate-binding protein
MYIRFAAILIMSSLVLTSCSNTETTPPATLHVPTSQSLSSSSPAAGSRVRIGSKNFAEQYLLAEMYALLLEQDGHIVERKFGFIDIATAHAALLNGQIDLYPEYTGNAMLGILRQNSPPNFDASQTYATVANEYQKQFGLVWLQASPADNCVVIALRPDVARRYNITTLSQFALHANNFTLVGPPSFLDRADGLPGLALAYGPINLKAYLSVEPDLRYSTLGEAQADGVVGRMTDSGISAFRLVALQDDKGFFPSNRPAPVVRQATLEAKPMLRTVLDALAPKLTETALLQMNYEVTGQQKPYTTVAREFLQREGLLK